MGQVSKDLFPLPPPFPLVGQLASVVGVSRSVRRRLRRTGLWQQWANEGVATLNALSGRPDGSSCEPSPCQLASLEGLAEPFKRMGLPPPDLHPAEAFRELCGNSVPYLAENLGLASFERDNVALPSGNLPVIDTVAGLSPEHAHILNGADSSLLNSPEATAAALDVAGIVKPHHDPAFNAPRPYADFLRSLQDKGIITFEMHARSYLGCFFVRKKDGRLRLVLDTRLANCHFGPPPPHSQLPTAAALASIEARDGEEFYMAGGDIECAFYRMSIPKQAERFMTLPSIKAKYMNISELHGTNVDPETLITPRLLVLPMGWSWSLWLCQSVHERAGELGGLSDSTPILDKKTPVPLDSHDSQHAIYVDNFLVLGHDPHVVQSVANSHSNYLTDVTGLVVHENVDACCSSTFAGLDIDGRRRSIRVGIRRTWRLRLAFDHILCMQAISGAQFEKVLGHFTWSCLVKRECLSILCCVYSFYP